MNVDNVAVKSQTDRNGNSYTSSISNDKLTNKDFLKLLLEELKLQDPTKPVDSKEMLDSQMKMSTIQTNMEMSKSIEALSKSYSSSSLSNVVGLMGKTIENGQIDKDTGIIKSFVVDTIESKNNEMFLNVREQIGFYHDITDGDGNTYSYDENGKIYDKNNDTIGINVVLNSDGSLQEKDGKYVMLDDSGNTIKNENLLKLNISKSMPKYNSNVVSIPIADVKKVYG